MSAEEQSDVNHADQVHQAIELAKSSEESTALEDSSLEDSALQKPELQESVGEEAAKTPKSEEPTSSSDETGESFSVEVRQEVLDTFGEVERQALVEALLFAQGSPLSAKRISDACLLEKQETLDILDSLKMKHSLEESGLELFESAGKFQLRTKPAFALFIQQLRSTRPKRLSQQALETLSIVAYRQPIVRSDVEKIRGVDATPTLKTLLDRGFIKIVGHLDAIGQPALYGTTNRFLEVFGLSSLRELPTLRDLQELEVHAEEQEQGAAPDSKMNLESEELQDSGDLEINTSANSHEESQQAVANA